MQMGCGTLSFLGRGFYMPKPPVEADIRQLLKPREPVINRLYLDAWDRWCKIPGRAALYRRVRAGLIHNFVMNAAPTAFAPDRGIHVIERRGYETLLFLVDDRLLFRFKMGDSHGISSNIETQTELAFTDPQESLALLDLPDVQRVDVCYVLNMIQTKIDRVLVVARDGPGAIWSYQIYPEPKEERAPVMLPMKPRLPKGSSSADNVVRLPDRGTDKKKRG